MVDIDPTEPNPKTGLALRAARLRRRFGLSAELATLIATLIQGGAEK